MWHGVAFSHRCSQPARWPEEGRTFGRRRYYDGTIANACGVFVLLPFPGIIDVQHVPTAIRFVTINRCPSAGCFPGIIRVRYIIRLSRHIRPSRLILGRSCIRPAGPSVASSAPSAAPAGQTSSSTSGASAEALKDSLVGFLKAFRDPEPGEAGARPQPGPSQMAAVQQQPNAVAGPATQGAPAAPPTSLTPPPTSPAPKSRAQ
jgi:hypothetical protein